GKSFLEAGCAIDNDEFRRLQTSIDPIIEERPPGRLALPAHVLDRQQNFLAVLPDAQRHEKENRRGLLVEPHPHHCAVENEPDDWLVLQGARVPIVPIALHLAPNSADRVLPHGVAKQSRKRPAHPARAMTVPITRPFYRPAAAAGLGKARPFIPVPPKRSIEFRFQEFLDEAANAGPHPGFQGIEPIVPKKKRSFR